MAECDGLASMSLKLTFVHNLSRDTYAARANGHLPVQSYLIAPGNARGELRSLARGVSESRLPLVTDNGNFASITKIRKQFEDEAGILLAAVAEEGERLGRSVRRGDLSSEVVEAFDELDRRVRAEALDRGLSDSEMLVSQLPLQPQWIIGAEDLTMASWLSLDIEHRYTSRRRRDYRRYNAAVAKRANAALDILPDELRDRYYSVASAVSYNTAFDAGRVFGEAGLESVSMGFGAYMADSNWVDHVVVGRCRIDFGANLPARYIRTVAVAVGFWDGYREATGGAPRRFHFLGLGAPIMIPPVVFAARETAELSFDATSPIKDATKDGTLYTDSPALLKVRIRKVAYRLAREIGHRWNCPCPFCQAFDSQYPFDYDAGYRWFRGGHPEEIRAVDMQPGGSLYDVYPLLSEPKAGDRRRAVNYTRTGHNHWILERLMTSLERAHRDARLETRVCNLVDKGLPRDRSRGQPVMV